MVFGTRTPRRRPGAARRPRPRGQQHQDLDGDGHPAARPGGPAPPGRPHRRVPARRPQRAEHHHRPAARDAQRPLQLHRDRRDEPGPRRRPGVRVSRPRSCWRWPSPARRTSRRAGLLLLQHQHRAARPADRAADGARGRPGVPDAALRPARAAQHPAAGPHLHRPPRPAPAGTCTAPTSRPSPARCSPRRQQAAARAGTLAPLRRTNVNPSWAWTAGAGISTAEDLARFVPALVGGGLLAPPLQRQRLDSIRPRDPSEPASPGYGYALAQFGPMYGHTGELPRLQLLHGVRPGAPEHRRELDIAGARTRRPGPAAQLARTVIGELYRTP